MLEIELLYLIPFFSITTGCYFKYRPSIGYHYKKLMGKKFLRRDPKEEYVEGILRKKKEETDKRNSL